MKNLNTHITYLIIFTLFSFYFSSNNNPVLDYSFVNENALLENSSKSIFLSVIFAALVLIFYLLRQRKIIAKQNEQLKRINDTKNHFFSIIAHDLRGPIISFQNISKKINYLKENGEPKDVDKMLEMTDVAANHLNSLLDNLLNWTLSENGNYPYQPSKINLKLLCEESVQLFKPLAKNKGIKLKQHAFTDQYVLADKNAISIILRNLINNAVKFSMHGDEVVVTSKKVKGNVLLRVKDTGVGIAPQIAEKLYDLTEEKVKRGTEGEKGTGLGLVLCKQLVEMNHGKISLQTQVGKGTEFTISFPSAV